MNLPTEVLVVTGLILPSITDTRLYLAECLIRNNSICRI